MEKEDNNILIDFSALKSGGGCQLALNFIENIDKREKLFKKNLFFLIPSIGPLKNLDQIYNGFQFIIAPTHNYLKRTFFEIYKIRKICRKNNISLIYTFFGAGLPHDESVKSIVTVAYPIICYDESPFWNYISFYAKYKLKIKNYIRLKRLSGANKIFVETSIMKERLSKILNKDTKEFQILDPAPSDFVKRREKKYCLSGDRIKFLFLSGNSAHKNLWRLPELAGALNGYFKNFEFVISVSEEEFLKSLKKKFLTLYMSNKDKFRFIGSIHPSEINSIYEKVDFLISLSDLESYSNNYMEAWKASVPLIVSDRDFSREVCKDSALYIEPHSPDKVALEIFNYINEVELINNRLVNGKRLLLELPDTNERVNMIMQYCLNIE